MDCNLTLGITANLFMQHQLRPVSFLGRNIMKGN